MKKKIFILLVCVILLSGCVNKMSDTKIIEEFDSKINKENIKFIKFDYNQGVVGQESGYLYTVTNEGPFYITVFDNSSDELDKIKEKGCVTVSGTNGTYDDCNIVINNNVVLHFGQNSINSKEDTIKDIFESIK